MWVQCVLCDRYVEIDDEKAIAKRFRKRPDYAYLCSLCGGGLAEVEREMLEPGKLPPELAALERSAAPSFASWSEPSKPRQGRQRGEEVASGAPPTAFAERPNGRNSGESRRPNPDRPRPASAGGPSRPGSDAGVPQSAKPQLSPVGERASGPSQPPAPSQPQGQGGGRQRRRSRSGKGSGQGPPGPVGVPGQPKPNGQAGDNGRHRGRGRGGSRQNPAGASPEPQAQSQNAGSGRTGPSQPQRNQ